MIGERDIRRVGRVCVGVCVRREGGGEREKLKIYREIYREKGKNKNTEIKCVSMNQIIKRFSPKADSDLLIL